MYYYHPQTTEEETCIKRLSNPARDVEPFVFGIQILCFYPPVCHTGPAVIALCVVLFPSLGKQRACTLREDRELFKTYSHDYNVNFSELSLT